MGKQKILLIKLEDVKMSKKIIVGMDQKTYNNFGNIMYSNDTLSNNTVDAFLLHEMIIRGIEKIKKNEITITTDFGNMTVQLGVIVTDDEYEMIRTISKINKFSIRCIMRNLINNFDFKNNIVDVIDYQVTHVRIPYLPRALQSESIRYVNAFCNHACQYVLTQNDVNIIPTDYIDYTDDTYEYDKNGIKNIIAELLENARKKICGTTNFLTDCEVLSICLSLFIKHVYGIDEKIVCILPTGMWYRKSDTEIKYHRCITIDKDAHNKLKIMKCDFTLKETFHEIIKRYFGKDVVMIKWNKKSSITISNDDRSLLSSLPPYVRVTSYMSGLVRLAYSEGFRMSNLDI